ncbi:hypothetical protein Tco_1375720 [Tanacetum coccineum]
MTVESQILGHRAFAELPMSHYTHDLYALLEDAQDRDVWMVRKEAYASERLGSLVGLSQSAAHQESTLIQTQHQVHETRFQMQQAELAALRETDRRRQDQMINCGEQQRRARQPGPEARIPDHQDASGDADNGSHSSHGDNPRNVQTARPYFYADFMKCQPLNFKGTKGVVGLTRWIEKMESVFNISGCAIKNQIRTLGPEAYAMTWEVLKKKITDKYCPQGEIKKLEIELWNLKVKERMFQQYTEQMPKRTSILPDAQDVGMRLLSCNDLMDQKTPHLRERQSDNKMKADDIPSRKQPRSPTAKPFNKRQNVAKVYNMGTGERKPYGGSLPKCNKCHLHHNGPCTQRCHKCTKTRAMFALRLLEVLVAQMLLILQKAMGQAPKGNGCLLSGGVTRTFQRDCP